MLASLLVRDKRTRRQLLEDWPPDYAAPCDTTLYNWLLHAVELGLVRQEGTGRKTDPFRYWLPDKDAAWKADPVHEFLEQARLNSEQVMKDLRGRGRAG